jgi:hypothetical protein
MESGWIRRYPAMPGFLLEQSTTSRWVFRRYPVVTRPLAQVATTTSDGVAVLRPEIALLFKAKATRFKDQGDFDRVSPTGRGRTTVAGVGPGAGPSRAHLAGPAVTTVMASTVSSALTC